MINTQRWRVYQGFRVLRPFHTYPPFLLLPPTISSPPPLPTPLPPIIDNNPYPTSPSSTLTLTLTFQYINHLIISHHILSHLITSFLITSYCITGSLASVKLLRWLLRTGKSSHPLVSGLPLPTPSLSSLLEQVCLTSILLSPLNCLSFPSKKDRRIISSCSHIFVDCPLSACALLSSLYFTAAISWRLIPYVTVGAVSFGQIVKAGEPVFAAATNAILLGVSWAPFITSRDYVIISILAGLWSPITSCTISFLSIWIPPLPPFHLFPISPLLPSLPLTPFLPHLLSLYLSLYLSLFPHLRTSITQWCTQPSSPSLGVSDSHPSKSSPSHGPLLSLLHLPTRPQHSRTSSPRYLHFNQIDDITIMLFNIMISFLALSARLRTSYFLPIFPHVSLSPDFAPTFTAPLNPLLLATLLSHFHPLSIPSVRPFSFHFTYSPFDDLFLTPLIPFLFLPFFLSFFLSSPLGCDGQTMGQGTWSPEHVLRSDHPRSPLHHVSHTSSSSSTSTTSSTSTSSLFSPSQRDISSHNRNQLRSFLLHFCSPFVLAFDAKDAVTVYNQVHPSPSPQPLLTVFPLLLFVIPLPMLPPAYLYILTSWFLLFVLHFHYLPVTHTTSHPVLSSPLPPPSPSFSYVIFPAILLFIHLHLF